MNQEHQQIKQKEGEENVTQKQVKQEDNQPQELQRQLEGQDYQQYQQPQQQQYYEEYMHQEVGHIQKAKSKDEYPLNELTQKIIKQINQVNELVCLGLDWSVSLFQSCGWSMNLVKDLLGNNQHKELIHYNQQLTKNQIKVSQGECIICGVQNIQLVENLCGHEFCAGCWNDYLRQKLIQNFRFPFPMCMQQKCLIKMSFSLCKYLSQRNKKLQSLFYLAICRSYATYSKSLKICKGRNGFSCNNCIIIKYFNKPINCGKCGNFICPRCGQSYHGSSSCFIIQNWIQINQKNLQISVYGYMICPYCKEAVQKVPNTCNYLKCKCKGQFCFTCGQKWLPNHSTHGMCYRADQIKQLRQQQKQKKENQLQYILKVEDRKNILKQITQKYEQVYDFKVNKFQKITKCFLDNFQFYRSDFQVIKEFFHTLQEAYCQLWGQTLSLYFYDDKLKQKYCQYLKQNLVSYQQFLYNFIEKMYNRLTYPLVGNEKQEKLSQQAKTQFEKELKSRSKQLKIKTKAIQLIIQHANA